MRHIGEFVRQADIHGAEGVLDEFRHLRGVR
jgi:hypothetical protein